METQAARRILLVDDEEKFLESCGELLESQGYQVDRCQESARVVGCLKAKEYDAVLLDIRMPGIEGTELLPLVKKIRPQLPVILVSAYCDETNASYYHALGAFEAISKPFSTEALLDALARAVKRQERIPLVLTTLSLLEGRNQVYRKLIVSALLKTNWNQLKAAELLGVSRYCLIRWMKKLDIAY
jgi:DNA-binding NtrC family response regulator